MVTYYVVQSFKRGKRGALLPDQSRQARDQHHCEMLAERLAETCHAVVAFSRAGDPTTGDWEDAQLIAQYGPLPDELMEMAG
ncbi:hypothetical protein [Pelagibacterium mangrovi]|uniref:hypothetical protein n=1 Tax=Pelagibacterium mangrovi TaxID=3119828 RepID=UPI002FC86B75